MQTNKTYTMRSKVLRLAGLFMVFGVLLGLTSQGVFAQVPPANTPIGNQASATYVDNGGNTQSITSNTVETIVQQVAGVTITSGISLTVSPGGQVTFPHTITNTGNGTDVFNLTINQPSGDFTFDNVVIYADENQDGVPDDFDPITVTDALARQGSPDPNTYGIVIVADVPVTATDGDVQTLEITATSNYDSNESATATNTTQVDEDAVVNVQKNRDKQFVEVGDTVTYSFSYAESGGSSPASNLIIKDPLPAGVTYVPGSGVWSGASGISLTDSDAGETASGITYEFDGTGTADSVIVKISNINAGASGTISFKVTVDPETYGQTIVNNGTFKHDDISNFVTTNNASIQVAENYSIIAVGSDTVYAGEVNQGAIVNFVNKFVNDGTATDTYNITASNSDYPAGTTFTFYKADASNQPTSPFTDTNTDGIPDTGPIDVGDSAIVILQVNLPSGASGGPYSVVKTLTSINDASANDFHVDKLEGIATPTVDIRNPGELGAGQGPEPNPVTTKNANPGTTVNFTLFILNTSNQQDNYQLNYSTDTTATGNLDSPGTLPAGWTASFRDPNNGNTVITSTGNIASGATKEVTFRVNVPAGYDPGQVSLFVRALSQTSGAIDVKHEAVYVQTVRGVTLVANQTAQVSPGGSVDYIHTLTVTSNVTENNGTDSDFTISLDNSVPTGWTAVVYWDADESGTVNTGDSLLTSAASPNAAQLPVTVGSLVYGDQIKFIVQVTASTGLNDGSTVTTTLEVDDLVEAVPAVSNEDQTEVQAGRLSIDKYQSADTLSANFTKSNFSVAPGDTVWYEIVVVNDGSESVTTVNVQDVVPSYTKMASAVQLIDDTSGDVISGLTVVNSPSLGATGTVTVTASSLLPTQQFRIRFAVKVDE